MTLVFHESVGYVTWLSRETDEDIRERQASYEQIHRSSQTIAPEDGDNNQSVNYNCEWGCHDVDDGVYQVRSVTLGGLMESWIRKMVTKRNVGGDVSVHFELRLNETSLALKKSLVK